MHYNIFKEGEMDEVVRAILEDFLTPKQVKRLEDRLLGANCIIYHSKLPKLTEAPVLHVDATPNDDYPLRVLSAYRQHCNCRWAESTDDSKPQNPLIKIMNEQNSKRAVLLDKAIEKLTRI